MAQDNIVVRFDRDAERFEHLLMDTRYFVKAPGHDEPANLLFVEVDGEIELWFVRYDTWRDERWSVKRALEVGEHPSNPLLVRIGSGLAEYWLHSLPIWSEYAKKRLAEKKSP